MHYPALYNDADAASNTAQREFFALVVAEFLLLVTAAIFSLETFAATPFLVVYAFVFLAALGLMLVRTVRRSDQDWYKCRALAESIKTSSWRYAMRAHPFDDAKTQDAKRDFRIFLHAIFDANQHIGARISGLTPDGDQITKEMDVLRDQTLSERKEVYLADRIKEQREWYAKKARTNKKVLRLWIWICATVYVIAGGSVLVRIPYPHSAFPTEPLIVIASSLVGWIQIKRYSELASAYSLAAHEIGIIKDRADEANTNATFSDFVNESELAFSREHTQWIARQHEV